MNRLPRPLHPAAWWGWAIAMATAASRTTNPLLLALLLAAVAVVVTARRGDSAWARGFGMYIYLALAIIAIRVAFRIVLDGQHGTHVLFTLPEVPLPEAAAGIRLGGPVTLEGILAAVYDGLQLATIIICVGAANVLADARRLLKSLPGALHEIAVAVTVSLTFAPQMVESAQRIRRARRLRGDTSKRRHLVETVAIPVLTDALDRSLQLAAAMDTRGYGRSAAISAGERRSASMLLLAGLVGMAGGTYGLLDSTTPAWIGTPILLAGVAAAVAGIALAGRRVQRSRYRPDPWRSPEWTVIACGAATAATFIAIAAGGGVTALVPSVQPLRWPELPLLPVLAIAVGTAPALLAPPTERHAAVVAPA